MLLWSELINLLIELFLRDLKFGIILSILLKGLSYTDLHLVDFLKDSLGLTGAIAPRLSILLFKDIPPFLLISLNLYHIVFDGR